MPFVREIFKDDALWAAVLIDFWGIAVTCSFQALTFLLIYLLGE